MFFLRWRKGRGQKDKRERLRASNTRLLTQPLTLSTKAMPISPEKEAQNENLGLADSTCKCNTLKVE